MQELTIIQLLVLLVAAMCLITEAARRRDRRRRLTAEEQLIMDLFQGYDTDARAVINTTNTVNVEIQFLLLRIQRLDERSQVLLTTGLVITEWFDERLTWAPRDYNNIKDVVVRADRIWIPELSVINSAEDMIQDFEKIRVLISSNGKVHWEPGGVFTTTCDIDITHFPFDSQVCPIEIGAWAYKSTRMNLTNVSTVMETQEFKVNGEWEITATAAEWVEVVLPCCPDIRYSKVVFTLFMNRRYMFYMMNIILPCVLLSTLILIVFCVPPDAGEKISAGISVLLAFTVFLLMLADNVPRTSLDVPILVIYLGSTMAFGTASVCLTVIVLNLHHRGSHRPVPQWARVVFLYYFARAFGFQPVNKYPLYSSVQGKPNNYREDIDSTEMYEVQHILTPSEKIVCRGMGDHYLMTELNSHRESSANSPRVTKEEVGAQQKKEELVKEWQLLARVTDRIFFCVVLLALSSSTLLILLSPWYSSSK